MSVPDEDYYRNASCVYDKIHVSIFSSLLFQIKYKKCTTMIKWPHIVDVRLFAITSRFRSHWWRITALVTRVIRRVPGTAYPSGAPDFISCFSGVRVTRSLVFYVVLCRSLFFLLSFFIWPLCCLFFFDLRSLIGRLGSSNFSHVFCVKEKKYKTFIL